MIFKLDPRQGIYIHSDEGEIILPDSMGSFKVDEIRKKSSYFVFSHGSKKWKAEFWAFVFSESEFCKKVELPEPTTDSKLYGIVKWKCIKQFCRIEVHEFVLALHSQLLSVCTGSWSGYFWTQSSCNRLDNHLLNQWMFVYPFPSFEKTCPIS